jgi:hypothetical protein
MDTMGWVGLVGADIPSVATGSKTESQINREEESKREAQ